MIRIDNMAHLKQRMVRVPTHLSVTTKCVNHAALARVLKKQATPLDCTVVQSALKVALGLCRKGIAPEATATIKEALNAFYDGEITAQTISKLNRAFDWHDAQLDVCTYGELEDAIQYAEKLQCQQ